jgi:hypothetical protein
MPDPLALQTLCGQLDRGEIHRGEFLDRFTREVALDIGCSRAAVRLLVNTPGGAVLRCLAMYDTDRDAMHRAPDMAGNHGDPYFDALLGDGCVVASDAHLHPATAMFVSDYLEPQDVRSLLDVSFSVNGVLYGTFSCEQIGTMVAWTPHQLKRLREIGSRASLTLTHAITSEIDTAPGALWQSSTPNRLMTMPMALDIDRIG